MPRVTKKKIMPRVTKKKIWPSKKRFSKKKKQNTKMSV